MESILFWEVYNYRLWCLTETCLLTRRRPLNQLSDHGRHAINKESDYRRPSKLENYAYIVKVFAYHRCSRCLQRGVYIFVVLTWTGVNLEVSA